MRETLAAPKPFAAPNPFSFFELLQSRWGLRVLGVQGVGLRVSGVSRVAGAVGVFRVFGF